MAKVLDCGIEVSKFNSSRDITFHSGLLPVGKVLHRLSLELKNMNVTSIPVVIGLV